MVFKQLAQTRVGNFKYLQYPYGLQGGQGCKHIGLGKLAFIDRTRWVQVNARIGDKCGYCSFPDLHACKVGAIDVVREYVFCFHFDSFVVNGVAMMRFLLRSDLLYNANMYRTEATAPSLIDPVLADQAGGSILFAVTTQSEARSTPDHTHQRGQLLAATAGVMALTTEQRHLVVPPGYAIWLPPMHKHAMHARGQFSGWSIYVAPDSCINLPVAPQIMPVSGLLREAVLRAASWPGMTAQNAAQERVLAVILDEIQTLPPQDFVLALPADRCLLKITTQILHEPGDQRSLQAWAEWAGIAPRTLIRRFAQETGLSFSEWRQRARLMRAIEMLAAGTAVTTIAIELGYDSLSAFIAMFKRQMGVPPSLFVRQTDAAQADSLFKK